MGKKVVVLPRAWFWFTTVFAGIGVATVLATVAGLR